MKILIQAMAESPKQFFYYSARMAEHKIEMLTGVLAARSPSFLGVQSSFQKAPKNVMESFRPDAKKALRCHFYFSNKRDAQIFKKVIKEMLGISLGNLRNQKPLSVKKLRENNRVQTILVPPFVICAPKQFGKNKNQPLRSERMSQKRITLYIHKGMGFGTGAHATTQLCLKKLGNLGKKGHALLDFGSGSGIISIAGAKLGMRVNAVEVDADARQNAIKNFNENRVRVKQLGSINQVSQKYDLIIANIIRSVLIEHAPVLTNLLKKNGDLILSGLLKRDLSKIKRSFKKLECKQVTQKGTWYLIHFGAKI